MKKFCFTLVLLLLIVVAGVSQKANPIASDLCAQDLDKEVIERFDKAFGEYNEGNYGKSTMMFRKLAEDEADFASPVFMLGIIGVVTDRPAMIEKYFPQVLKICPEFEHPLLFFYLGVIEYSNARYDKAIDYFGRFLELCEDKQYDKQQDEAINYIQWSEFLYETTQRRFPFTPEKIEPVSTKKDETFPCISLDGNRIYFIRKLEIKQKNDDSFYRQTEFIEKQTLCLAEKGEEGEFDLGFQLGDETDFAGLMGRVSITSDERFLFFAKTTTEGGQYSSDIYYCEKVEGRWSEAKPLGGQVNEPSSNELAPCVSPEGNSLYFSSNRKGGIGGYDIYVSRREKDGTWGEPSNLGKRVNSLGDEMNPFIHSDNHNLYFSSNGWKTIGESDLFHIDLEDIKMKKPRNLGADINTENNEEAIYLLADGKTAYASVFDSVEMNHDICLFSIPQEVWAESVKIVGGKSIISDFEDKSCRIWVNAMGERTSLCYESNPQNGDFALALLENEDYFIKTEKEGYAYNSQILRVQDSIGVLELTLLPIISGESYPLNGISFTEKGSLSEESHIVLDDFLEYLKENPRIRIELFAPENQAEKIVTYLRKSGIRRDRVSLSQTPEPTIGYRIL